MPRDLHPLGCACARCCPVHPADRHRPRWPVVAAFILILWAFPLRWLVPAALALLFR